MHECMCSLIQVHLHACKVARLRAHTHRTELNICVAGDATPFMRAESYPALAPYLVGVAAPVSVSTGVRWYRVRGYWVCEMHREEVWVPGVRV